MTDVNSAEFWLPKITAIPILPGVGIPRTVVVPYAHEHAMAAFEDGADWPAWDDLLEAVWAAVEEVGVPAFVRTDLASAKHDGPGSYRIEKRDDIPAVLSLTAQDNEMKFWPLGPTPNAFLVREWLNLDAPFSAFGGHPIAREWRYFASRKGVDCRHFYWPEHALRAADTEGWELLLSAMAADDPPDFLDVVACQAASVCSTGADGWSVDFAQDRDGKWWLIDMATAATSWHPDHDETDGDDTHA